MEQTGSEPVHLTLISNWGVDDTKANPLAD